MAVLRRDLLRHVRPDGGLDLYDPLLDRLTRLSPADGRALPLPPAEPLSLAPELRDRLDAAFLLEGPVIEAIRARVWSARVAAVEAPQLAAPAFDLRFAYELPQLVSPVWRRPEPWRRAAEERSAGTLTVLRGFLPPEFAHSLTAEAAAASFARLETDRVSASRARFGQLAPGSCLARFAALLVHPALRTLIGGVLDVGLPAEVTGNIWRLAAGDHMRVHPDGPRYAATFALGLNDGWRAADGGAIAFGVPRDGRFEVRARWLPFLGDVCVFAPHAESWHIVEPPTRERLTLSGWWLRSSGESETATHDKDSGADQ